MNSVPPRTTWNPERRWKHDSRMHLNCGSRCVCGGWVECVCGGGGGTNFRASPEPWLKERAGIGVGRALLGLRCYWPPPRTRAQSRCAECQVCITSRGFPSSSRLGPSGRHSLFVQSRCVCSSGLQMRFIQTS